MLALFILFNDIADLIWSNEMLFYIVFYQNFVQRMIFEVENFDFNEFL